ncbi:DNA repair protein RecO [Paludibacter sp.]
MHSKLSGLVLRIVKYSDKASIATVFTREHGCMSYMVYGISSKKSNISSSCFIPLSFIEITANHHPQKEIHILKDARILYNTNSIHTNPLKNALCLFITELLFKTLKRIEPEERLFDFLEDSIKILDDGNCDIANFHLIFMLNLASYLGFKPSDEKAAQYFDLLNGEFVAEKPTHIHFLNESLTPYFSKLLSLPYNPEQTLTMSRSTRSQLLDGLIEYFKLHVPEFYGLNSVTVLHELFN